MQTLPELRIRLGQRADLGRIRAINLEIAKAARVFDVAVNAQTLRGARLIAQLAQTPTGFVSSPGPPPAAEIAPPFVNKKDIIVILE